MPHYSFIHITQELFEFPTDMGYMESSAVHIAETHPKDIVFWSDENLMAEFVWLSFEVISYYEDAIVIGVSSSEENAKRVCQDREDNWGAGNAISALPWGEDDMPHRAEGYLRHYTISRHKIDKEVKL